MLAGYFGQFGDGEDDEEEDNSEGDARIRNDLASAAKQHLNTLDNA